MPFLSELDSRGYRYCFLYTLMNNPRCMDPKSPPLEAGLNTFRTLAGDIGPERVIWRYDPIVPSNITDSEFHKQTHAEIARSLRGYTIRSVISFVDMYRKLKKRMDDLEKNGIKLYEPPDEVRDDILWSMARSAAQNGMEIAASAEEIDLSGHGIKPGKCIDGPYLSDIFGLDLKWKKDPSQRKSCGCVVSKDIGMYNSCLFECAYCYATTSFKRARTNYKAHDPESISLIA